MADKIKPKERVKKRQPPTLQACTSNIRVHEDRAEILCGKVGKILQRITQRLLFICRAARNPGGRKTGKVEGDKADIR